jgi:hypothetical protein
MARSFRHTPIRGMTTAHTEKGYKRERSRAERSAVRQALHHFTTTDGDGPKWCEYCDDACAGTGANPTADAGPKRQLVRYNAWLAPKDGKSWFGELAHARQNLWQSWIARVTGRQETVAENQAKFREAMRK